MENRGQKRSESVDALPADKRACSSLEFRPSSSNSPAQMSMNSAMESHDADMETSCSTSTSTRSEGDGERESTYGSCDSGSSMHDYYRYRSSGEHSKLKKLLSSLGGEEEESRQLALLTELCESLTFFYDSSLSSLLIDSFSPILVTLARHSNPDIMLLALRAITYFCDINPRSSSFLVRHDVVPTLCERLITIEYLDLAEQCLQALEKISREHPLACLQSGAIMAVLTYIDFFSTSVQRVALSTVVNICKKLSNESSEHLMRAVPILCNLLQYEDKPLVESVAICLIRIGDKVHHSSDMLDEFCKHGLIEHAINLIGFDSRTVVSAPTSVGLIGLLAKLAAGSNTAFMTLLKLDITSNVKGMLSASELSHGMLSSIHIMDGNSSQMREILKLLNELLPEIVSEQVAEVKSEKEAFLLENHDIVQKYCLDIIPALIQVVNSGVNLSICYGCLSVIHKSIHFSSSDMLQDLLQAADISSFLAGVFMRKDHHVILSALRIVDATMHKLPNVYLSSFIKEGILFAIRALLSADDDLKLSPLFAGVQIETNLIQKQVHPDKCPCFEFDVGQSSKDKRTCKLQKERIQDLANHILTAYFKPESVDPMLGVTSVLQKLRALSDALIAQVNKSLEGTEANKDEEETYALLKQIILEISKKDSVSAFEFVESNVVKALVNFLTNGSRLVGPEDRDFRNFVYVMEKRFEALGRLLLSCTDSSQEEFPFLTILRRLQNALTSLENYPVFSSSMIRQKNSYVVVPYGRCTSYLPLKVLFVKDEGEVTLRDYVEESVSVDPFVPLHEIKRYLWNRVGMDESKIMCSDPLSGSSSSKGTSVDESTKMEVENHNLQVENVNILSNTEEEFSPTKITESLDATEVRARILSKDPLDREGNNSQTEVGLEMDSPKCSDFEVSPGKLDLYWEGKKLNNTLTLYQSIMELQTEKEHDSARYAYVWTHKHKIVYKRGKLMEQKHAMFSCDEPRLVSSCKIGAQFFSEMFLSLVDLEILGPTSEILFLLKTLEGINRFGFHFKSQEGFLPFSEARITDLHIIAQRSEVPESEFINMKLTEKLEQLLFDPRIVSAGAMPAWSTVLMAWCPFLFGFDARLKYFHLSAFHRSHISADSKTNDHAKGSSDGRLQAYGNLPRKKVVVHRDKILESAVEMMELRSRRRVVLEVEFNDEVGTGLGPTMEFYTLVCEEFRKSGIHMWRDDSFSHQSSEFPHTENPGSLPSSSFGLFPRPWSPSMITSNSPLLSEVLKKFTLFGQIMAKALEDRRLLDIPFSKAFYKLILGKELTVYDILSFDSSFGKVLLDLIDIVRGKKHLISVSDEKSSHLRVGLQSTDIEDLSLDFSLPGYPDYVLTPQSDSKMVSLDNLEEYISLVVNATLKSGIARQIEAFKSGFNQIFNISHLKVFREDELEHLLCGEAVMWNSHNLLDHIKFDHGYTISSPPIVDLLEILKEFDPQQQRAFLQFITGAPRLPTGGLAFLNPKLTIVRKHFSDGTDSELPSVMTCANYLKLPAYSCKEVMKEKLLYAITEGQGAFHLS